MKSLATNFLQYLCENKGTRRIVVDKAPPPPSLAYQTFDLPARDRLQTTLLVQIECDDIKSETSRGKNVILHGMNFYEWNNDYYQQRRNLVSS